MRRWRRSGRMEDGMLTLVCPDNRGVGALAGFALILVCGAGSVLAGLSILKACIRPVLPWSKLDLDMRVIVGVFSLVAGAAGLVLVAWIQLKCQWPL